MKVATGNKSLILIVLLAIVPIHLFSTGINAQSIASSISEILRNTEKYDGKLVRVQGRVQSLKFSTSKRGNPYTTFLVVDSSDESLKVFSFGTLSLNRGDRVMVSGRYQKVKNVPPRYIFYNEIDTTEGGVQIIR
jgi:hypothetical protein